MNNEQEAPKSNGKLSLILNEEIPTPTNTSSQDSFQDGQDNKETTTTNGSEKVSPKIRKYPQPPKELTSSKNESSTPSKTTTKPVTKGSKQSKTGTSTAAASSKNKTSKSSRKRPLSPSDSEEGRETSQELERCRHPKHDEYMKSKPPPVVVVSNKKAKLDKPPKLVGMPKRLEGVLNIDRGTKMCSRCINQTDKDPQYTTHKKYISRKTVYKKNERSRLAIDMNK